MSDALNHPVPWMVLPFVLLLAALALGPILFPAWWGRHYSKVSVGLGAVTVVYYLFWLRAGREVLRIGHEYLSFVALIGSLYVVSGGIHIKVKGEAKPLVNTIYLAIGAVIANVLGTTGAAMLLIRPWLRMNKYRVTEHHAVFFIFIVANVGGCLTPIGDPPLFLGFLQGIPFWWVAKYCWPAWLVGVGWLLLVFYCLDYRNYLRAPKAVRAEFAEVPDHWRFDGLYNLVFLGLILGAIFLSKPLLVREAIMIGAAVASYFVTKRAVHEANHFNFHPIQEIALLFLGIFATMMPALEWLQLNAEKLGTPSPGLFYWSSGLLSSILDNAPTYLSFFQVATGAFVPSGPAPDRPELATLLGRGPLHECLLAISIGAVFFGATTYIGNGPNFMVKAIAEEQRVHLPGFFGYLFRYALPVMLPMLLLVWWLFFR
jgi:Na+/H+ antiporter NhaD/arsenite permease-like protein